MAGGDTFWQLISLKWKLLYNWKKKKLRSYDLSKYRKQSTEHSDCELCSIGQNCLLVNIAFKKGTYAPSDWKKQQLAVRETCISRYHGDGGWIDAPLKPTVQHCTIVSKGLRGAFILTPIMPGDASFSDSEYEFILNCSQNETFLL